MLSDYTVANEANKLIDMIRRFWNNLVSEIKVVSMTDKPYDMFTLSMKLYGKHDVLMEYDRGTISIRVRTYDNGGMLVKKIKCPCCGCFTIDKEPKRQDLRSLHLWMICWIT